MAHHRTPVGVQNGNFRNRDYYFYAQALRNPYNRLTERMMNKKKLRFAYWLQRFTNAMSVLRTLPNWEKWFDDDDNVMEEATDREYAVLIEAHVRDVLGDYPKFKTSIHRGIFIWQDNLGYFVYGKETGVKHSLYPFEFATLQEAQAFIDGLPFINCGYGFVMDLILVSVPLSVE